mgnify:CR=1 FL=1
MPVDAIHGCHSTDHAVLVIGWPEVLHSACARKLRGGLE